MRTIATPKTLLIIAVGVISGAVLTGLFLSTGKSVGLLPAAEAQGNSTTAITKGKWAYRGST